ncbi:MAG: GntR family transcriptional regulator [Geminicoccaceae bacterium]|nr:GntR family transcriptional regulator [Geminicoccaceae bacterium]
MSEWTEISWETGSIPRTAGEPSAASRIHADLWRRIVSLELPPGLTLNRSELARGYGTSQTPLREAMLRLADEGLVDIFRQSRTVVSLIDTARMAETQLLRVALETELVRRIAETRPKEVLDRLGTLHDSLVRCAGDLGRMARFYDIDRAFHRTLFDALDMRNLHDQLQARSGHLMRIRRLELPLAGKMKVIAREHEGILAAIRDGDAGLARERLRVHISGSFERVHRLRERYPHFFTGR